MDLYYHNRQINKAEKPLGLAYFGIVNIHTFNVFVIDGKFLVKNKKIRIKFGMREKKYLHAS